MLDRLGWNIDNEDPIPEHEINKQIQRRRYQKIHCLIRQILSCVGPLCLHIPRALSGKVCNLNFSISMLIKPSFIWNAVSRELY
jgi:hypothetical protein